MRPSRTEVCILAAGTGSRMGAYASMINKGLLPIRKMAAISHIINRFPAGSRFVVAVNHLSHQIAEYLRMAHPKVQFELVGVDDVSPSAGPGYSALCCSNKLQGPFFLACSDTYWPDA